jgi:hypothetical protein
MKNRMIAMGWKQHLERVCSIVPERYANYVEVTGEVDDFRLKFSKCCNKKKHKYLQHFMRAGVTISHQATRG